MVTLSGRKIIGLLSLIILSVNLFCGIPQGVEAHMNTVGYSDIEIHDKTIDYRLYLDPSEVAQWVDAQSKRVFVIGEASQNEASKPEVSWTAEDLKPFIYEFLTVTNNGETAEPSIKGISMAERKDGPTVLIDMNYVFSEPIDTYEIDYKFFFDQFDALHQNFATVHIGDTEVEKVFNKDDRSLSGHVASVSSGTITTEITVPIWLNTMWEYVKLGVEHIWTGYDHLLFVAALVILKQPLKNYIKILTAFTVGHSITLAIAALDIIRIPANIIEPLIALSIVYIAIENIWIKKLKWRWLLALGFGLIHGFGFAQILQGTLGDHYILSLFSFNLGVEIGQIIVAAVLLPLLILASRRKWYRQAAFCVSGGIAIIGLYWLIERTLF
uniref:HupE/UreJ family protein n=2 Tax=Neobacillus citreus TaxID=2833578 RepID=A0A942T0S0_9BACI